MTEKDKKELLQIITPILSVMVVSISLMPKGSVFTYIIIVIVVILVIISFVLFILFIKDKISSSLYQRTLINKFFEEKLIYLKPSYNALFKEIHKERTKQEWTTYAKKTLDISIKKAQAEWKKNHNKWEKKYNKKG